MLEDEALARAESGVRVLRDPARMKEAAFQARRRGLSDLADAAEAVLDDAGAERVLALAYLAQLHRQAARRSGHGRKVC